MEVFEEKNAMDSLNKKKVIRKHKKWLSEEIKLILDYLEQEKNIETPTAQAYYRKLISSTGINATWDLIKWKVRHLKCNYRKANDWFRSNTAGLLYEDWESDGIKAEVLRICPQYYQLDRIFGSNYNTQTPFETVDITEDFSETFSTPDTESISSFKFKDDECSDSQNYTSIDSAIKISDDKRPETSNLGNPSREFEEKLKKYKRKSTSSYMTDLQGQRISFNKMKFEFEKQKHEVETKLNQRRIDLEEMKLKADIEFKKKLLELKSREIVRDEKLKILEMEKDERLKRYEIDMKYKHESQVI